MADRTYVATNTAVTLTASSTKTLVLLNPVSTSFMVTEIGVSLDSASSTADVQVELYRVTTIGSATGATITPVRGTMPDGSATTGVTAIGNLTAEPTAVEILRAWYIQPYGGLFVAQFPLGREPGAASGGQRIGLRVVTPAATTPSARAYIEIAA